METITGKCAYYVNPSITPLVFAIFRPALVLKGIIAASCSATAERMWIVSGVTAGYL